MCGVCDCSVNVSVAVISWAEAGVLEPEQSPSSCILSCNQDTDKDSAQTNCPRQILVPVQSVFNFSPSYLNLRVVNLPQTNSVSPLFWTPAWLCCIHVLSFISALITSSHNTEINIHINQPPVSSVSCTLDNWPHWAFFPLKWFMSSQTVMKKDWM